MPLDLLIYCGLGSLISGDHISSVIGGVMRRLDPAQV